MNEKTHNLTSLRDEYARRATREHVSILRAMRGPALAAAGAVVLADLRRRLADLQSAADAACQAADATRGALLASVE